MRHNHIVVVIGVEQSRMPELRAALTGADWTTHYVQAADRALEIARLEEVFAVLCDHESADMNWLDLLSRLRSLKREPAFIVASSSADELFWADVFNRGGFDVILKPFVQKDVMWTLNAARHSFGDRRRKEMSNSGPSATPSSLTTTACA